MSKKLWKLIDAETKRQQETISLIPSENIASPQILAALGTPLTNKYAEGYPGRRYYQGNSVIDEIELYTQDQGLKAFGLKGALSTALPMKQRDMATAMKDMADRWFINVQPLSGAPANAVIYLALAKPGEIVMGQKLSEGGHLTHGHPVNFSGTYYRSIQYGVDHKTGLIDYAAVEALAEKHKPRIIYSGTTAYSQIIDFKRFGRIAKKVGAYHVTDMSHIGGLVAAGVHPSPFPHADVVMTTTHKTMRGPRGAVIYAKGPDLAARINKALIPGIQGGPHEHQIAAMAIMFEDMQTDSFKQYARQIIKNAAMLAAELKKYKFELVAGGTATHLLLVDLKNKNVTGSEAALLLENAGLVCNKNTVPGDESPFYPSGIRLGTPSATSRGMKKKEMKMIAAWIHRLIDKKESPTKIRKEVLVLCKKFPLPYK